MSSDESDVDLNGSLERAHEESKQDASKQELYN